jgi:long-chain acyl-CoA synthetase
VLKEVLIHRSITERLGNKICLIHGNVLLAYQEFSQQVDSLAYRLATQIKKGDKVLIKLADPLSQLLYFFGVIKAGGACIIIDPATSEEVCAALMDTHQLNLYIHENFPLPTNAALSLPEVNDYDLFLGALSSGSTGTPKLIWRDHQSWTSAFPSQSTVFQLSNKDTLYLVSSLVYTANLNACLHILSEGGTVMFASNSLPRTWEREITANHISAIFMVPTNYKILLKNMKAPLPQITSVVTCGAKMDLSTVQALVEYFPSAGIYEYYGASELGHVSYATAKDLVERPSSVGRAFPQVTISIEDDNTIWVESPYTAPNYRPKATVGDLGRLDKEGYLYLLGRKHSIINMGGVKVIPEQVETVLLQCPGVAEAVVGGIDDPIRGQKVCAWIVKNQATLMAADIFAFCQNKMRPHYCPQKIIFLNEIPLNKNGKIDRISLRNNSLLPS